MFTLEIVYLDVKILVHSALAELQRVFNTIGEISENEELIIHNKLIALCDPDFVYIVQEEPVLNIHD